MNYHNITKCDMANGEGVRVVLWTAGCSHACPGCHNRETWGVNSGIPFDDSAVEEIYECLDKPEYDGITFSGGDPLHINNRETILKLAKDIKERYNGKKTCWLYTGYLWEDVNSITGIEYIDTLIDGRYVEALSNPSPEWRGSKNQRIINVQESLRTNTVIIR